MTGKGRGLRKANRRQAGFALLLVLWVLVLLSVIAIHLSMTGRTEARIAFNVAASAEAEALADAGVARAVYAEAGPDAEQHWSLDGGPHELKLTGGTAVVRLYDENGKINPNLAPEGLIAALLQVTGINPEQAKRLAAAVEDWISPGTMARPFGAKAAEYSKAGLSYGPPNAPLESLDELNRVLGMTPQIFANLRPYLSLYSTVPVPDPQHAPLPVQQAVTLFNKGSLVSNTMSLAQMVGRTTQAIIHMEVTARTANGAVFIRDAVVRLEPLAPKGYIVLEWRQGELPE